MTKAIRPVVAPANHDLARFTREVANRLTQTETAVAAVTATVPSPSDAIPLVESGTGSAGTSLDYARAGHVHPAASVPTGIGGYTVDCIAMFNTVNLNLKTAGDVNQVIGTVTSGPSGTAVPAGVAGGVTVLPVNSTAAYCTTFKTDTTQGFRRTIATSATIKTVEAYFALAQFGLDRTKPFEIRLLLNNTYRAFVNNGDYNRAGIFSSLATSNMFAAMNEIDSGSFGSLTPRSVVYGLYNGTYVATGTNQKNVTTNLADDLWTFRFEPLSITQFSKAVASVFPSTTPSDAIVGHQNRGRVSLDGVAASKAAIFPSSDDMFFTHIGSNTACDLAILGMHVIQRA